MSETSSHDSFYDSLSDLLEDGENAAFFPGLSAFLSQEEIHKSLDLARRAIASSETDDCDCEEVPQCCSPSPRSRRKPPAPPEARPGERASPGTPGARRQVPAAPPPAEQAEHISSPASRRKPGVSPLLARPSYIRSLRKAGKQVAKAPGTTANPLNDKAATLIEELTSIFREAAKPRTRSPDGESSSPDSGYLSPKNQPSDPRSASASQSPTRDQQDIEAEARPPAPGHHPTRDSHSPSSPPPCSAHHPPAAPRFIQKLRSQEVAEGSRVHLECRVTGNPPPRMLCIDLTCTLV
uniref:Immunoglobulin I-set domain-containing protein n=1 Tax=Bos mutus grunniens TaxID=30521 RepID=A0A8B9XPJ6_BOSMU